MEPGAVYYDVEEVGARNLPFTDRYLKGQLTMGGLPTFLSFLSPTSRKVSFDLLIGSPRGKKKRNQAAAWNRYGLRSSFKQPMKPLENFYPTKHKLVVKCL